YGDWSSDVCSSDLDKRPEGDRVVIEHVQADDHEDARERSPAQEPHELILEGVGGATVPPKRGCERLDRREDPPAQPGFARREPRRRQDRVKQSRVAGSRNGRLTRTL